MASPVLHIKDSYYFEVPKFLWRSERQARVDFPEWWVKLDPDYQLWEAHQLYHAMEHDRAELFGGDELPPFEELEHQYTHWKHEDHANFGKPFESFLREAPAQQWFRKHTGDPKWEQAFAKLKSEVKFSGYDHAWSKEKIAEYNDALDGVILIPQPFGTLRNGYEVASGFCISKFMIIEVVVALIMVAVFAWLGRKVQAGRAPRGRLWNMLEAVLLFLRDEVARPAIGKHDADRFVPLLWTIFLFILGCNLMGLVPWTGAPTGAWAVTFALAVVTLGTVYVSGTAKHGLLGFWKNQVPSMDLPIYMAVLIIPVIFVIEVFGLLIRHAILSVRLLANMVAGHLVLLGIMGLAFTVEAALEPTWWVAAPIAVVGSTLFSCLELFVAFLQAYVFVFLSALFIGASVHHH